MFSAEGDDYTGQRLRDTFDDSMQQNNYKYKTGSIFKVSTARLRLHEVISLDKS
jgi:hypothetical protein